MKMQVQRRLLPSTSMLMAFDAAARTGSFTIAAKELNLTQGAVSRQVSALENQLDVTLFKRVRKTVQLTDTGKVYAREVHAILQQIRNASLNAMTSPLSGILNLAILPTFGTRWLMPRLPLFLKENPDITVNFTTKLSPFDFQTENLDAAIHYGQANWPETNSTFLMNEETIPVCSRKLFNEYSPSNPEDIKKLPLLHLATRDNAWNHWFQSKNLAPPEARGMLFEQFSMIAQAAAAGLGVALLPKFLIESELEREELVIIWDEPLVSNYGYHLITPTNKVDYAPVAALRQWLLQMLGHNSHVSRD